MSVMLDALAHSYDVLVHFTPTQDQRKAFAKSGVAMPDGSFYIRNSGDLGRAIQAVGRATPNASESETARRNAVRRHIMKRARALNLANMIPDTWNSDGSLKQSAISEQMIEDFIAHFGVKGMHWGIRRDRGARGDKRFAKAATKFSTAQRLHATALSRLQEEDLPKLNSNPRYREHSLRSDPARQKEYDDKIQKAYIKHLTEVASEQRSPSGRKAYSLEVRPSGEWKVHVRDVQHADESFTVRPVRDPDTGLITSLELVDDTVAQGEAFVDTYLAHFGVRGMHWGIHRSRSSRSAAARGKASTHVAPHISEDAARAMTLKRTVKAHGTQALSNKDLQDLVTRMNLESQHGKLNQQQVSAGRKFVQDTAKQIGQQQAQAAIVKYAPKGAAWVAKKIAKKAIVPVATATAGVALRTLL